MGEVVGLSGAGRAAARAGLRPRTRARTASRRAVGRWHRPRRLVRVRQIRLVTADPVVRLAPRENPPRAQPATAAPSGPRKPVPSCAWSRPPPDNRSGQGRSWDHRAGRCPVDRKERIWSTALAGGQPAGRADRRPAGGRRRHGPGRVVRGNPQRGLPIVTGAIGAASSTMRPAGSNPSGRPSAWNRWAGRRPSERPLRRWTAALGAAGARRGRRPGSTGNREPVRCPPNGGACPMDADTRLPTPHTWLVLLYPILGHPMGGKDGPADPPGRMRWRSPGRRRPARAARAGGTDPREAGARPRRRRPPPVEDPLPGFDAASVPGWNGDARGSVGHGRAWGPPTTLGRWLVGWLAGWRRGRLAAPVRAGGGGRRRGRGRGAAGAPCGGSGRADPTP